jgi:hypothetical protein
MDMEENYYGLFFGSYYPRIVLKKIMKNFIEDSPSVGRYPSAGRP